MKSSKGKIQADQPTELQPIGNCFHIPKLQDQNIGNLPVSSTAVKVIQNKQILKKLLDQTRYGPNKNRD